MGTLRMVKKPIATGAVVVLRADDKGRQGVVASTTSKRAVVIWDDGKTRRHLKEHLRRVDR